MPCLWKASGASTTHHPVLKEEDLYDGVLERDRFEGVNTESFGGHSLRKFVSKDFYITISNRFMHPNKKISFLIVV